MIELLVALVLLGIVSTAIYRVLVNNQRLYMAQTQRIDLSQNIRAPTRFSRRNSASWTRSTATSSPWLRTRSSFAGCAG